MSNRKQLQQTVKTQSVDKMLPYLLSFCMLSDRAVENRRTYKLFNVKSKFGYIDKNKQKSEIANNDKFEKRK
jgi:hypothetical protein